MRPLTPFGWVLLCIEQGGWQWRWFRAALAAAVVAATVGLLGASALGVLRAAMLAAAAGVLAPPRRYWRTQLASSAGAAVALVAALAWGAASAVGGAATSAGMTAVVGSQANNFLPNGRLANVDWIAYSTHLDCRTPGLGTELIGSQFVDVTEDGWPEAFVTFACRVLTSSAPEQLEVFDGSSDPKQPRRLAILIQQSGGLDERGFRVRKLLFDGRKVTVDAAAFTSQAGNCCPDRRVIQVFTWTGKRFHAGPRKVLPLSRVP